MLRRPEGDRAALSPRVVVAAVVAVAVTLDVVLGGPLTRLDRPVSEWVRSTGLAEPGDWPAQPAPTIVLDLLTLFGDRLVVLTLLPVLAVLSWRHRTVRPLVQLAVLGLLVVGTVSALKLGIGRPPPVGLLPGEGGRSYPSGHTVTAVAFWGLLAATADRYAFRGGLRRAARVLAWLAPLLTAVAMLLRDYHWLSDLIGGVAIGIVLLGVLQGLDRLALRHWRGARGGSGVAAGAAAGAGGGARPGLAAGAGPGGG